MENYTNPQNAQIINVTGEVSTTLSPNLLQMGDSIESGTILNLVQGSELILQLEDGTQQRVYITEDGTTSEVHVENIASADNTATQENSEAGNVQGEIAAIQDLIASEDGDVEGLPETAIGQNGNEGTDFVTVNRVGDETLAVAGFDTTEQQNDIPEAEGLNTLSATSITDEDEAVSLDEDTVITGNVIDDAANGGDTSVIVTGFEVGGNTFTIGSTATLEEGDLTLNSDGSYTFDPIENYNGDVPVATYTVENASGDRDVSTLSIVVDPIPDLIDDNEVRSHDEDTTITGDVLENALSPDDPLTIIDFEVGGETFAVGDTAALEEGALTINADGTYTFVPSENYNGDVPVANYTVEDGAGDRDVSTLTIVTAPVKDLIDDDEVETIDEDTTVTGNALLNASSPDGPITITGFEVGGDTFVAGSTASLEEGDLTLNADGSYTFVPSDDFNGDVPVVTYTVEDGAEDEDLSTLTITVNPVKDLIDDDEVETIDEDTTLTGNVLLNASSPDDPITVIGFEVDSVTYNVGDTASTTEGDLTLNSDGSYTFVPSDDFNGNGPVATYTVEDGAGDTDISTLSIIITPTPDLIDDNESVRIDEDTSVSGNLLTNASSPDNPITVTSFTVGGVTYAIGATAALVEGNLTINGNGSYTFNPTPGYSGNVPVATYTVEDGADDQDTSTLTIVVDPVVDNFLSDANESVSTDENTPISGTVLGNTSSSVNPTTVSSFEVNGVTYTAGDTADIFDGSSPAGSLTLNGNGTYTFAPSNGFMGIVPSVNYIVINGAGLSDPSTLSITVNEGEVENNPPVAADDTFSINEGESVTGNVLSHIDNSDGVKDHDGDGGSAITVTEVNGTPLSFGADGYATVVINGDTLKIKADGTFTYTNNSGYAFDPDDPDANFPTFEYTVNDGQSSPNSDTATVTIAISDTAPNAVADNNFVLYTDDGGSSNSSSASGNILRGGSTHDRGDSSADGTIKLIQVKYFNELLNTYETHNFTDSVKSLFILTDFGVLSIDDAGDYTFYFSSGVDISTIPSSLEFGYTIEDGDTANPETDSTTLTIHLNHEVSGDKPAQTEEENELIDLSITEHSSSLMASEGNLAPVTNPDLSDLFAQNSEGSLDNYLAFNGLADNEAEAGNESNDELVLENSEQPAEELESQTVVTNGFLSDGATLVGDTAPESLPKQYELDSTDFL